MTTPSDPTKATYGDLTQAYDFFNGRLFGGRLPPCLVTLRKHGNAFGYFCGDRFGTRDGKKVVDEIAMNPVHFERTPKQSLATLVHEMTHLEQHRFPHRAGKPSRSGYHNKGWAKLMKAVGLIPSDTAQPGGKETGPRVSHYIQKGGKFDVACDELLQSGLTLAYVERNGDQADAARRKAASKTKYTCPGCGLNAWAKPGVSILCRECEQELGAHYEEEPDAA